MNANLLIIILKPFIGHNQQNQEQPKSLLLFDGK